MRISDKADVGLFLPHCIGQISIAAILHAQRCMPHVQDFDRCSLVAATKLPLPSVHFGGCAQRKTTAPQGTLFKVFAKAAKVSGALAGAPLVKGEGDKAGHMIAHADN
jgi:hypothetical protein